MRYVIAYDFPANRQGDRRRTHLANYLCGLGLRVQYSVFEVDLPPERVPQFCRELEDRIDPQQDAVRIYPLCAACCARIIHLGQEAACEHDPLVIW